MVAVTVLPHCPQPEKLSSIDDRGQIDHITVLPRPHVLDSAAAAADLDHVMPHVTDYSSVLVQFL